MRRAWMSVALLLALPAHAQEATAPSIPEPTIAAPVAPAAPVAAPVANAPANPQADMMMQMQKVMGKKNSQEAMGQVIVIGSLLGCTQKTAGAEATNAFYQQMQTVGKTVEAYCKQGHATEARALLLATFAQNKTNPVVASALTCYDTQLASVNALGGPRMAADAAHYARWVRNPAIAQQELKETDVCRPATAGATPMAAH